MDFDLFTLKQKLQQRTISSQSPPAGTLRPQSQPQLPLGWQPWRDQSLLYIKRMVLPGRGCYFFRNFLKETDFFFPDCLYGNHLPRLRRTRNTVGLGGAKKLQDFIFFDIETTGLSGGAGTFIFLAGFAWFSAADLIVEQAFMADYPGEADLIAYLSQRLDPEKTYVSFNGKSFDYQVIKTRFLMNRSQLELPHHLDLLHLSRRLWKNTLDSCTLVNLEKQVLSIQRVDDVPGFLVPLVYLEFVKSGQSPELEAVLTHNYRDILALVALLSLLDTVYSCAVKLSEVQTAFKRRRIPLDWYGLGLFLCKTNRERAVDCFELAYSEGNLKAGLRLAAMRKADKDWPQAVYIWEGIYKTPDPPFRLYAGLELAKYYEHWQKNYSRALKIVEELGPLVPVGRSHDDWQKRAARLSGYLV